MGNGQHPLPDDQAWPAVVPAEPVGPRVLNKHHGNIPGTAKYIGRGSPWGNPFVIGRDGDRAEVIAKHEQWALGRPGLIARARQELAGYDLVCFCAPAACHGDFWLRVANAPEPPQAILPPLPDPGEPTTPTRSAA